MKPVIRTGDLLSSGGVVIAGTRQIIINGAAVACVGDKVICPLPGHGPNAIAEGDKGSTYLGRAMALHGYRCECGCTLITSLPQVGRA
ncbi:PAAR domain-containing protein [Pseudomonas sp. NPDC088444]|uniref:PAAR domain-containing protein n=1 Tax=Pseudomonas sp. NPDC088444 TaxID=3364456 RepID=UPI003850BD3D